jgi:hypothetical protein
MAGTGYVDYRQVRSEAGELAEQAVTAARGVRDRSTALEEIKAANVANQATTQAILNAIVNARDYGHPWSDIGLALGITKQGAQRRLAEADEDALIRAIIQTRSAGQVVRVPKPIAILLPAFQWIRDGLDSGSFSDASLRIDGGQAFIPVSRGDYLLHHPGSVPDRYLVQHLTVMPSNGANWTTFANTEDEAKLLADRVWGPDRVDDRQEIIDNETGARWIRASGHPEWIIPNMRLTAARHIAARGYSSVTRPCSCGNSLVAYFRDEKGRDWAICPSDPAGEEGWLKAFRLLEDQSENSLLRLATMNTAAGPAVTAQLLNSGVELAPR